MNVTRYAACIEYDGSGFSGWQNQKGNIRTVQSLVEAALSKVADAPVSVITAGRTDARVHASHQIIHFDSDADRPEFAWCRGANRFLSKDVRLRWVQVVDNEFHARFSALSRSYRFIIYNDPIQSALYRNHATPESKSLDPQKMAEAGKSLLGEHDFTSFRAAGCQAQTPIRTIEYFDLMRKGPWIWFDVRANAFLQHMVRNIAGSLIEIGCGKREVNWMAEVLAQRDRKFAGATATSNGLYLVGVEYPKKFALSSSRQDVSYWSES
jgi:tRNA pseudouridine38-40 synthase